MTDLVEVRDYNLDEETLRIGIETYIGFRLSEEYQGNKKREAIDNLNDWLEREGVGRDRVVSYIERLRKVINNSSIPLVEEDFESLEATAEEDPEQLSEHLNELYEEKPLSDRVNAFRRAQDVNPTTISVLLTTYNPNRYVLYREEYFRLFLTYFTGIEKPNLDEMSVGERYELFCEYCAVLQSELTEEGSIDAELIDGGDFISSVARYPECRYNFILLYLFRYSNKMEEFEQEPSILLDELREMPQRFLREQADKYDGRAKIAKIRYEILDLILDDEEVDIDEIAEQENQKHDTNIMNSWDKFKIPAQMYFNYSKERVDKYIQDLADYVIGEMSRGDLSSHVVTYQGATSIPTSESWTVIYPSIFDDHKLAYQLFLSFKPSKIEYGLSNGSEVSDGVYDPEELQREDEVSIEEIVEALKQREDRFWELNEPEPPEPPEYDYDEMDWFDDVENHLRRKKQVIFHGAVGTGKTYGALNFAKWWIDRDTDEEESLKDAVEKRLRMVTFHPTFSYEDFIEGITAKAKDGGLVYEPKSGVFREMCEEAKEAYEDADSNAEAPRYILIIDEVNRGNIPKIFGETITLIEKDKRLDAENEMKNELPHSDDQLVVPPNLYIIGTMNTADRSIALVDSAIRRRFRFKNFPPDYEVLYDELEFDGEQDVRSMASVEEGQDLGALSILALKQINERIRNSGNLGKGKQIGHSYLIGGSTEELLVEAWKNEILPLLEEYYFGDMDRLREHIFDGGGENLFDWEEKQIDDFDSEDLRDALYELVGVDSQDEE